MELAGRLIIKAQLGEDIRRIPIHNEDITYDELILMMQRVFKGKLNQSEDLVVKYKDEDGDLVTIFDDSDLTFAIQCSKILKITLLTKFSPATPDTANVSVGGSLSLEDRRQVRLELQSIRDRVTGLLDRLDGCRMDNGGDISTTVGGGPTSDVHRQLTSASSGKEFDPLSTGVRSPAHKAEQPTQSGHNHQKMPSVDDKVMSSFNLAGSSVVAPVRSSTPDSQASSQSRQHPPAANGSPAYPPSSTGPPQTYPPPPASVASTDSHGQQYHQQGQDGQTTAGVYTPNAYSGQNQGPYSQSGGYSAPPSQPQSSYPPPPASSQPQSSYPPPPPSSQPQSNYPPPPASSQPQNYTPTDSPAHQQQQGYGQNYGQPQQYPSKGDYPGGPPQSYTPDPYNQQQQAYSAPQGYNQQPPAPQQSYQQPPYSYSGGARGPVPPPPPPGVAMPAHRPQYGPNYAKKPGYQ